MHDGILAGLIIAIIFAVGFTCFICACTLVVAIGQAVLG